MAVLLANLDDLKLHLDIKRPVHDGQLTLYLSSASNVVQDMVEVDPNAIPPEATLATLMYAQYLWELTQRRSARNGEDEAPVVDPRPWMMHLLRSLPSKATDGPLFTFPVASVYPAS